MLYTSGSTGKPKGVLHAVGGWMVHVGAANKYCFDVRPGDVFWCGGAGGWCGGGWLGCSLLVRWRPVSYRSSSSSSSSGGGAKTPLTSKQ
jgi:acyl-CoA synthetase (AMP-forming)/AMP-acid ligase II